MNRPADARAEADRALAIKPTAYAYSRREQSRLETEPPRPLRADLDAAGKLDPTNGRQIYQVRSQIHADKNQDEAAAADYGKLIELGNDTMNVRLMRGEAYARLHKADLAAVDFAQVRNQITSNAVLLNDLCWDQAIVGMTLDLALKDCDAAIALTLKPDESNAMDSRGLALFRLARYADAVAAYDAALAKRTRALPHLYSAGAWPSSRGPGRGSG